MLEVDIINVVCHPNQLLLLTVEVSGHYSVKLSTVGLSCGRSDHSIGEYT